MQRHRVLRGLLRLFGSGSGCAPENELWDKLVSESGPSIREAGDVISGLIDRAGGLSAAIPEAQFSLREADRPFEEIISGAERELEELCGHYDYRQLLFLSRLCTGVPALRDADADTAATRVRVQNADRWALRCGDRSSARDPVLAEDGGVSVEALPGSIFRDAAKLHWLANFHQWRVIDRAMFNFLRLVSQENGLPDPRLILLAGGGVGREWDAASARTLGYPYMIHGGPEHELWLVDYVNTLPFLQSLAGEVYFTPGRSVAARTSTFDRLLAESLERVDGIEAAFVADRPDPNLPNVEFRFDGGSQTREIDVPLRRGRVLVAVQTWARNLDLRLSEGEYRAMRRRWEAARRKLRSTDEKYTDYLLHHPEGKRRMGEQGLGYVLPVLCGPFTEPVPSLEPRFWLRPLSTGSYDEALRSLPRVLSPAELEHFLSTATERELRGICEATDWAVEDD